MRSFLKKHVKLVAFLLLLLTLLVLSVNLRDARQDLYTSNKINRQTSLFLNGELAVEGYACGVLSPSVVQEFIGNSIKKSFSQIPLNVLENISWQDSCRYVDKTTSSKYVQLFINTFQTSSQAKSAYETFFQIVNDNVSYPAENYGEVLVYDSGVFYLLRDKRVIRIAASNGSPSESEQFAFNVFERIIPELLN